MSHVTDVQIGQTRKLAHPRTEFGIILYRNTQVTVVDYTPNDEWCTVECQLSPTRKIRFPLLLDSLVPENHLDWDNIPQDVATLAYRMRQQFPNAVDVCTCVIPAEDEIVINVHPAHNRDGRSILTPYGRLGTGLSRNSPVDWGVAETLREQLIFCLSFHRFNVYEASRPR